jgi:hypothetical protein
MAWSKKRKLFGIENEQNYKHKKIVVLLTVSITNTNEWCACWHVKETNRKKAQNMHICIKKEVDNWAVLIDETAGSY